MPTTTVKNGGVDVGQEAPSFTLPATQVGAVSNETLKGKPYVLYFYPKDDTPGCTAEACSFRDTLPDFGKLGVNVIGVSRDSLDTHEAFSKKYRLTFSLASDINGEVSKKFGVLKEKGSDGGVSWGIERSTFLVDDKGIIRTIWRNVSIPGHVDEIKKAIFKL
ncbi:MAG: peroxiredoxin [Alphaproteobacteria bacterium]|nr:peroxiredoxin [Alphaproteobacteria bacterium]